MLLGVCGELRQGGNPPYLNMIVGSKGHEVVVVCIGDVGVGSGRCGQTQACIVVGHVAGGTGQQGAQNNEADEQAIEYWTTMAI